MTTPTPPCYSRADGLIVEAIQDTPDTVADLVAWIPPRKIRLEDMAGTPAMYVFTIAGGFVRVWLWDWIIRYEDGNFDVLNNTRFTEEFSQYSPVSEEPSETTEPGDVDHDAAMLAALSKGHTDAINTASYWSELAETLTGIRAYAMTRLPATPCGSEEWYEKRAPEIPFDLEELAAELSMLSGLITKAHTIAAVYTQDAAYLDAEYAAVAPD